MISVTNIKPGKGLESDRRGAGIFLDFVAEKASLSWYHLSRNWFEERSQPHGNVRTEE